jgi:predicted nucleotidyltransferase
MTQVAVPSFSGVSCEAGEGQRGENETAEGRGLGDRSRGEDGDRMMRVGLYARVSTADKDQDPDTQRLPLREFCQAQGWTIAGEFVDSAPATDYRARFGSVARGEARADSDVDFLVEMDTNRSVLDLSELILDLEDGLGREVDVVQIRRPSR